MANARGKASSSELFGQHDPVFRPWPLPSKQPTNIAEFVARLKAQGIEFRDLTDEGLRKQIDEEAEQEKQEQEDGGGAGGDGRRANRGGAAGRPDAGAAGDKPKGIEAMIAKRDEALIALDNAAQNGLIVVDFVSLLLSKDRPTQAMQTLSPLLREKVGIGTLSAGRIANVAQAARALQIRGKSGGGGGGGSGGGLSAADVQNLDETTRANAQRLTENKTECVGWQLLAMDLAAEMLLAARKRLRAELRREHTYWSEVLAVRDRGWALSRVPGQRRVLRVKFGFSESAPDLRALGFAPLRRVKRGHVALDLSALGPPSALVVTLRRRDGRTAETGRSTPPRRVAPTAPLEDRILEARNTVYAKELWRELSREARLMVSHGVALRADEIVFPAGAHTEGVVTLEPLQPAAGPGGSSNAAATTPGSPRLNGLAEVLCSAVHILLAHGHRGHFRQRSVPAPPSDTVPPPPTYFLLRPIVANLKYEKAVKNTATYLADLCAILHGVGQTGARFTFFERPLRPTAPPPAAAPPASEALCAVFLAPREFSFELQINAETRILIRSRTTVAPLKAQYLVQLLPPAAAAAGGPASAPPKNPLFDAFPPADNYGTLRDVLGYVGTATARVLTAEARRVAQRWAARSGHDVAWTTAVDGMALQQLHNPFRTLRFSVGPTSAVTELDALVAADAGSPGGDADDGGVVDRGGDGDGDDQDRVNALSVDSPVARLDPVELRLYASWPLGQRGSFVYRKWAWSAASLAAGGPASAGGGGSSSLDPEPGLERDLESVIEGCVSGKLRPKAGD